MSQLEARISEIRAEFPILSRSMQGRPLVYLDNASSSQKPFSMIRTWQQFYSELYSKIEENHAMSKGATKLYEEVRSKIGRYVNADAKEIVFLRSATEAINLVATCFERAQLSPGDEVVVTILEHHSNLIPWMIACKRTGARLRVARMMPNGDLDLEHLASLLNDRTRMVAVTHVSNALGSVAPVKEIARLAHAKGIPVLVDGAQSLAHLPIDVQDLDCDFYAGSGHKMGGPSAIGILYGKKEWLEKLPPYQGGSTMAAEVEAESFSTKAPPSKFEAGTAAFGEAIAWGAAIDYWHDIGGPRIVEHESELMKHAREALERIQRVRLIGAPSHQVSSLSFTVDGMEPAQVDDQLSRRGIAVRSGTLGVKPLFQALGLPGGIRVSVLFYNTHHEIDALAQALVEICGQARQAAA
jgi:cysteine desulfurase / selenocysteine lyase